MIPLFKVFMADDASSAVQKVLTSGFVGQGSVVKEFEKQLSAHLYGNHVVSLNSCTSALHLACLSVKTEKKTKIVCPPLTCAATAWAILMAGMDIVWADVSHYTGNIDVRDIANVMDDSVAAVIAVHWGGDPADTREISSRYGVPVIEDAAHAFGSVHSNGIPVGGNKTPDIVTCFSFQAIKALTTCDGGAISTCDSRLSEALRLKRWFGLDRESSEDFRCSQNITEWGFKYHMNDFNAAVGVSNLPHINRNIKRQQDIAAIYDSYIPHNKRFAVNRGSSRWLYTLKCSNMEKAKAYFTSMGIQCSQVHRRVDTHSCVSMYNVRELPSTTLLSSRMLCIPCGWWMDDNDVNYVLDFVRLAIRRGFV